MDDFIRFLQEYRFENCLDVGAGTGLFLKVFYDNGIIKRGVGVEVDDKYFQVMNPHLRITGDAGIGNEKFDLIMFNDVLHHVEDKRYLLEKYISGYLEESGFVLVKEMNDENLFFKYMNRLQDFIIWREIIREVSMEDLKSMLSKKLFLIKHGRKRKLWYDHYFVLFGSGRVQGRDGT